MAAGLEDDSRWWRPSLTPIVSRCRNCDRNMNGRHCENRGCPWCKYCSPEKKEKKK